MKKHKVALLAALAISAAGFLSANAADDATTVNVAKGGGKAPCADGKCFKGGGPRKGGFMKELGITDAQLEQMVALKNNFENSTGPKKAELGALHRELRDDMTKPGVSKSELLSLQSKINGVRDELSTSRINYMADKMALLTDDQKAKIRSFALRRSFGPGGHGHHGGGHFRGKFHGGRSFGKGPGGPTPPSADKQV